MSTRGGRLADDTGVRIILWVITLPAVFLCWRELEPMLTFRPVDAVVVGGATSRVRLSVKRSRNDYYTPWIFYRYEVNGATYMGKQDRRTDLFRSPSAALQTATSIPKGTAVRAWYNPLRPDEAVLSREPNLMFLWPWILGCTALWFFALRRVE
jgi:uncharacterized protein DUF3592